MTEKGTRADAGLAAAAIGIAANLLLAVSKIAAGIFSKSMSIIADGLNNTSDAISSIVTMIGFRIAKKPADRDHPYGHARSEYVSSLVVSILVLLIGFELCKASVEKLFNPEAIIFSAVTVAVLTASILVKAGLYVYNSKMGKKINSVALKAVATDARNDVIMTSAVLASTVIEHFTSVALDGYMGLIVGIFIVYSGIMLTKETVSPILGAKSDGEIEKKIIEKVNEYPIIIGYHDLMIHDYGPGISFCSVHFEFDKNLDALYVHEIIDKIEREFLALSINLTVHYDPVITDSPLLERLKDAVMSALCEKDSRLLLHDFRCSACDGFTKVFFDVPLPEDLSGKKDEINELVNNKLNSLGLGKYACDITYEVY